MGKEYFEKAKEEIRNEWFKNHVANIEGEEGLQKIVWGEEGTFMYRTKYILSGNNVFISGDIGEAVYTLTCPATLENIKGFNLSYFTGKLRAFCESKYKFNEQLAKKQLRDYWKEYDLNKLEDGKEIYDRIRNAIEESSTVEMYQGWLMTVYEGTSADSDLMEAVWDFGQQLSYRLIGYWVGLRMAIEQLERKEKQSA